MKIPKKKITVFVRSDGSGDTYAFTRYLSDVSSTFLNKVGASTSVSFPVGVGEKGNEGMAQALLGTNGGIAYIAASYLIANKLPAVAIKNGAGNYVVPNLSAIAAAASGISVPNSNEVTIVDPGKRRKKAYPISTFTYAFVPTNASAGSAHQVVHRLRDHARPDFRAFARLLAAATVSGQRGRGGTQLDQLTV